MRTNVIWLAASSLVMAACMVGETGGGGGSASAQLVSKSASTVTGQATFTGTSSGVQLALSVAGATPGQHGVHLHVMGDCSDDVAMNAGGHWNPSGGMHGTPEGADHHAGDIGNITVGADGTGQLSFTDAGWTVGDGNVATDVAGHALIVHEMADDGVTQMPPGNAGARQACGVVSASP